MRHIEFKMTIWKPLAKLVGLNEIAYLVLAQTFCILLDNKIP